MLELGHDAQGLDVVVETAVNLHLFRQDVLAGVTERRMAQIVGERDGFREIAVESQGVGDGARDLGHFQAVGQARAIVVAAMGHKDLGLALQAPERLGVDDPVPVPREGIPRLAVGLGVQPPTASWGSMVADGRGFILDAWWVSTFPGLAILLLVLAINVASQAVRDALDPRFDD